MSGRRKQSYCDSYAETFTFIKKSTKGEHHAYCKSCNCDISISAGGANDIKRHMNNDKHKKNAEALQRASLHTQPLSSLQIAYKSLKSPCSQSTSSQSQK